MAPTTNPPILPYGNEQSEARSLVSWCLTHRTALAHARSQRRWLSSELRGGQVWEHHSHQPSGSPQGPAEGGWARWPGSGSGGLDTCSAGDGYASVSAVFYTRKG